VGNDRDRARSHPRRTARTGRRARARAGRCRSSRRGIVDDEGNEVAWDGESTGELDGARPLRSPPPTTKSDDPEKFDDGWLRTGDIASIDARGSIKLTDRSKDVIKSGGEWDLLRRARERAR